MAEANKQTTECFFTLCSFFQELEDAKDDKDTDKVPMLAVTQKPLHKVISEHKDVLKVVITLNNIIGSSKSECQEVSLRHRVIYKCDMRLFSKLTKQHRTACVCASNFVS